MRQARLSMDNKSPSGPTAFTYFEPARSTNGDSRKSLPCRIWPAVKRVYQGVRKLGQHARRGNQRLREVPGAGKIAESLQGERRPSASSPDEVRRKCQECAATQLAAKIVRDSPQISSGRAATGCERWRLQTPKHPERTRAPGPAGVPPASLCAPIDRPACADLLRRERRRRLQERTPESLQHGV